MRRIEQGNSILECESSSGLATRVPSTSVSGPSAHHFKDFAVPQGREAGRALVHNGNTVRKAPSQRLRQRGLAPLTPPSPSTSVFARDAS
jgi:hypothetical protein